ncbi:MAG: hypothetical protein QXX55_02040 [Candidatus Pacearchaeota archaeon]
MKINSKKGDITTKEVLNIILAAIGIFFLMLLVGKIYGIIKDSRDIEKATSTIDNILSQSGSLRDEDTKIDVVLESPKNWYLTSKENGRNFCNNAFCLCLCENRDCYDKYICKSTADNFFLLIGNDGKEIRFSKELPVSGELKYKRGDFYPFNKDVDLKHISFRGVSAEFEITPLFLRFNQEYSEKGRWEWSFDLENWMSLEETTAKGGLWDGHEPILNNKNFIKEFNNFLDENKNQDIRPVGATFLESKGIIKSEGVITFKMK